MTDITVVESIAANANDVFKILGDFGRIKVGGAITAFEIEGDRRRRSSYNHHRWRQGD